MKNEKAGKKNLQVHADSISKAYILIPILRIYTSRSAIKLRKIWTDFKAPGHASPVCKFICD